VEKLKTNYELLRNIVETTQYR